MGVDKIIVKSVLTTLAAIGVLLAFMVLSLCAVFPSTMMEITYDLGMENSSIHFAERAYKSSADVYYIAYATEVSIEEDKQDKILACGEKLIEDAKFEEYCQKKGETYGQFIYGKVCVSEYKQGKTSEAVERAYASLGGRFPKNNALVAVLLAATEQSDAQTVAQIAEKLNGIAVDGADGEYLEETKAFING